MTEVFDTVLKLAPSDIDKDDLRLFAEHIAALRGELKPSKPTETIFHYTNAEGLLGIVSNGTLRATQIACLNDTKEHRQLQEVVRSEAVARQSGTHRDDEATFYGQVAAGLADVSNDGRGLFVTCFSRDKDDLSQLRGYGGGVAGFALEFAAKDLLGWIASNRPGSNLVGMNYDSDVQRRLARMMLDHQWMLYERGLDWDSERVQQWDKQFTKAYAALVDVIYATAKHSSFRSENEVRLVHWLLEDDTVEFRAKQTLLARFIDVKVAVDGKLPIRSIMVGPGGAQKTSAFAVGDLLKRYGYRDVEITHSEVPFRAL